jgi:hypothetical protein
MSTRQVRRELPRGADEIEAAVILGALGRVARTAARRKGPFVRRDQQSAGMPSDFLEI